MSERPQRTIGSEFELTGVGLHTGETVKLRLLPANPGDSLQVGADTIQPVAKYKVPNGFTGLIDEVRVVFGAGGKAPRRGKTKAKAKAKPA